MSAEVRREEGKLARKELSQPLKCWKKGRREMTQSLINCVLKKEFEGFM